MLEYIHHNVENHNKILEENKIGMDKKKNIFSELFDQINEIK